MALDTPIPLWLILAGAVLLVLLAAGLAWRARDALPRRYLALLLGLRLAVVALILLLAANPFLVREKPDPAGVRVAVLADVSGSMATADAGGKTRIEVLQSLLDPDAKTSLLAPLEASFNVVVYPFVDSLLPRNTPLDIQPGVSSLGQALDEALAGGAQGSRPLGAVVLLSDGISLSGENPLEAGKRFRAAGVPVSTVGIGSARAPSNIALHFREPPRKAPAGQPLSLNAVAANDGAEAVRTTVDFYAGEQLIDSREVDLEPGSKSALAFDTLPELQGFNLYRIRFREPAASDLSPADDSDYAAVEITPPDKLEVLYLSNQLGYTFRFLQQMLKQDDNFAMRALIRVGEDKFFQQGFDDLETLPTDKFPEEPSAYLRNRILIVETGVLPELSEPVQDILRSFLEDRAGGILFLGPPELAPESLQPLLPVRRAELVEAGRRESLELVADPVFRDAYGGVLFMPPGPYLPAEAPAATAVELARGARVAAATEHGDLPVLALQAYGAGRSAFLGTESSWRWQMDSARGGEQYRLFWHYLLSWLGAGGKPRLETPGHANVRAVGEPLPLELRVLGRDFLPASQARVRARVTGPDGKPLPEAVLTPSPYDPGLFTGLTVASEPGEYRIDFQAVLPDGETLSRQEYFAAARTGRENEDIVFREEPLRDLARVTGGLYAPFRDALDILPLKLAPGLPTVEERLYWTHNALFLSLLLFLAGLEWFLRRRVGLR